MELHTLTDIQLIQSLLQGPPPSPRLLERELTRGRHSLMDHRSPLTHAQRKQLALALEWGKRVILEEGPPPTFIQNPFEARLYLLANMRFYQHEVFGALFLSTANTLIGFEELFHGTLDSVTLFPREIVKRCLTLNAASVIFVHNHPSGDPTPSHHDEILTKSLVSTLKLLNINVLDHIIIGDGKLYSFQQETQGIEDFTKP